MQGADALWWRLNTFAIAVSIVPEGDFPEQCPWTNPASAAIAGFECVQLNQSEGGFVSLPELQSHLNDQTAVFMITNPSTLGLFERNIETIAKMVHDVGGLVYIDGANMNAILGITRPGDFGGNMMHYNVHKTFTGPHGAGGPGSGPIAVRLSGRLSAGADCHQDAASGWLPNLRDGYAFQDDWSHADLLRERRYSAPRLLLFEDARGRGAEGRLGQRRAECQLSLAEAETHPASAARRTVHARVCRVGTEAEGREGDFRYGYRQAATRLWLPRSDGLFASSCR